MPLSPSLAIPSLGCTPRVAPVAGDSVVHLQARDGHVQERRPRWRGFGSVEVN
jgi:hypothetical protein